MYIIIFSSHKMKKPINKLRKRIKKIIKTHHQKKHLFIKPPMTKSLKK